MKTLRARFRYFVLGGLASCASVLCSGLADAQSVRADFNGDGFDDLAVGIPNAVEAGATGAGAVQVLYGSATGLSAAGNQRISQSTSGIPGSSELNDHFGAVVTAGDFNRDGFDELVVSTPFEDFTGGLFDDDDAGAITVIPGSGSGLVPSGSSLRSSADVRFHTRRDDEYFGAGLTVGDFTLDGTDDLLIATPGANLISFFVGGAGLPSRDSASYLNTALTVVAGDFNNDNFGDLALGVPANGGSVLVFASNGSSVLSGADVSVQLFDATVIANDHFSASMTVCDFDADGFDDLAVGVPDKDDGSKANTGAVSIYFGRPSGVIELLPVRRLVRTGSATVTTVAGDRYGASVASGDVNGDGFCDLLVGAPGRDVSGFADAGSAWVIFGSTGRFDDSAIVQEINQNSSFGIKGALIQGVSAAGDRFGSVITTGDFNGDGFSDAAIGAPGEEGGVGFGSVNVIYGSATGLIAAGNRLWREGSDGLPGVAQAGDAFGAALSGSSTVTSTTPGLSGVWSRGRLHCRALVGVVVRCAGEAQLRVLNPGSETTRRSSVRVYRSADAKLDAEDKLIAERGLRSLQPGESQVFDFRTSGSRAFVEGARFIAVLDPDDRVKEGDEENNTVVSRRLR